MTSTAPTRGGSALRPLLATAPSMGAGASCQHNMLLRNKRRSSRRGRTSSVALSASSSMMTSGLPPAASRGPPRDAGPVATPSAEPATRSSSMGLIRGAPCAARFAVCLCSPRALSGCPAFSCSPACEELPPWRASVAARVVCPLALLCFCLASRPFACRSLCERFVIDFFSQKTRAHIHARAGSAYRWLSGGAGAGKPFSAAQCDRH